MTRFDYVLMVLAVVLVAGPVAASTITWTPQETVAGDSDVLTTGVLQYATHWGGFDGTVNGVAFTAPGTNVTTSPAAMINADIGAPASLSTEYGNILRGSNYQPSQNPDPANESTLTLNDLTPGQLYNVQIWAQDPRAYDYDRYYTQIVGGPGLLLNVIGSGGLGQYAVGTFTADATTQDIVITAGNPGGGSYNALQVRTVPEPSSAILIGMAVAGLFCYA